MHAPRTATKLYCYVDETGQDTEGAFFLVVVAITSHTAVTSLAEQLARIEQDSGKGTRKWQATYFTRRQAYLKRILELEALKDSVFYNAFTDTKDYTALTTQVIIRGIQAKVTPSYQANIFIDGLNDRERDRARQLLKQARVRYRSVRGLRDEGSAMIRLCDALAGLLRDGDEGARYAEPLIRALGRRGIITKVDGS